MKLQINKQVIKLFLQFQVCEAQNAQWYAEHTEESRLQAWSVKLSLRSLVVTNGGQLWCHC